MPTKSLAGSRNGDIEFEVWGARGSRNLTPPTSKIANYTSCYSLKAGDDLFVFDGGRGLGVLSHAVSSKQRFRTVKRIHLFLSHAHMDHWEGLKDAGWFWQARNGLKLAIHGSSETIETVQRGYGHPAYVPLELLASSTLRDLTFTTWKAGESRVLRGFRLRTFALNHYSGMGDDKQHLSTLGYRVRSREGFSLAYLCDHEPTIETEAIEARMLKDANVAIVDAHFPDRAQHAFGHGSQEHAAALARRFPKTLILAGHHGPTASDAAIRRAHRQHGKSAQNFAIAAEGMRLRWNVRRGLSVAHS